MSIEGTRPKITEEVARRRVAAEIGNARIPHEVPLSTSGDYLEAAESLSETQDSRPKNIEK